MPQKPSGPEKTLFPLHASREDLAKAAKNCKACDLWKPGTLTVFGEGDLRAKIMLVGEQPGNQDDLKGKPFVGAAGKLLDAALVEAEIAACKPWLDAEIAELQPEVIVCLGATAAQALLGAIFG